MAANNSGVSGPLTSAAAISPHDDNDLANVPREIYVGTGGDITLIIGGTTVVLVNVPDGARLPYRATRVLDSGTDAENMIALW